MSSSKRKGAQRKSGRGSAGAALRRRDSHEEADGGQRESEKSPSDKTKGRGNGKAEGASPLLETTTQASAEVQQLLEAASDASQKIREAARTGSDGGGKPADGNEPAALISKINSEVRTVLETADEAAEKIREEAHSDARRLIEENRRRAERVSGEHLQRVTETTEQVLTQLSGVQRQLDILRDAFEQSIKRMGGDLESKRSERSRVWATKREGAEDEDEGDVLKSRINRSTRGKGAEEPQGISEGARLLALQQHMAGVAPDVIEKRLSEEFGIEDPRPVLEWMGIQRPKPESDAKRKKR